MARPQQISTETITQALAAHPEVTVSDLADALGIGQSTAAKHLATLEAAGTARREPGGREGGGSMERHGARGR
jgi:predicted ArsR family transcriptional regulator